MSYFLPKAIRALTTHDYSSVKFYVCLPAVLNIAYPLASLKLGEHRTKFKSVRNSIKKLTKASAMLYSCILIASTAIK